ncbi:MAG: hypothetical protein KAR19_16265 [Bacteroidales bacterium]|nr:hypothetical protein [Bacteroidales bacterium]
MKFSNILQLSFITAIVITCSFSCEDEAEEFQNSEPVTYYLSNEESLSSNAVPDGGWMYITNFLYSSTNTSCQWTKFLDQNITKGEFGYDLIFWSASDCKAEIEFILKEDGQEQVLASKMLTIPYINDSTALQSQNDIGTNPLEGINPKSGKNGELIFRITHMEGDDRLEMLYDANSGSLGCSSIIVYEDR